MTSTEQIQAVQKAEFESFVSIAEKTFQGIEKLAMLNLEAFREATQDTVETLRSAIDARDAQELLRGNGGNPVQRGSQKAMTYAQRFAEITGGIQADVAETMNQGVERMQHIMRDSVDGQARSLPSGGETAGAMLQNALSLTTKAMEAMQKSQAEASRLFTDTVQRMNAGAVKAAQPASTRKRTAGGDAG